MKLFMTFTKLIVIGGFAGAGKSTLSRKLSRELSIPAFEIDHMHYAIRNSEGFQDCTLNSSSIAFDLFYSIAERLLQDGCSLILDQNMGRKITWNHVERLASNIANVELQVFILECPFDLCVSRVELRTEHPNLFEVTANDLHDHKFKWDFLKENNFQQAIRIDATRSQEEVYQDVLSKISISKKPNKLFSTKVKPF